jgi:hypothetical protein
MDWADVILGCTDIATSAMQLKEVNAAAVGTGPLSFSNLTCAHPFHAAATALATSSDVGGEASSGRGWNDVLSLILKSAPRLANNVVVFDSFVSDT